MAMTATIGNTTVSVADTSPNLEDRIEERTRFGLTVIDLAGTTTFSKGQPVTITDDTLGTVFTGFVNQPKAHVLYPNPGRMWAIDCIDQTWLADKRSSNKSYKNQYAGTIAVDQVQRYGSADGLTCKASLRWDELLTEWQAGTLTNTVATTNATDGNVGDGDLELALAGSKVTVSGSGSGFGLGNGLKFTGYCSSGYSSAYTYRQIWSGSQVINVATDTLEYDVWIDGASPQIKAAIEVVCSDGTRLSSTTQPDQQGIPANPTSDLSGLATNTWYTRFVGFPSSMNGKTIVSIQVALAGTSAGTYTAYFRNILYFINTSSFYIFGPSSTLTTNIQVSNQGYSNVSLTQVQVENKTTQTVHTPISISAAGIVQSSQASWIELIPDGCTGTRETSIDGGATWQVATSGQAIPNLLAGMVATGRSVQYRDTLTIGNDPTVAIGFNTFNLVVNPAYTSTKTDVISTTTTATDFGSGTLTNLKTVGAGTTQGITLNGIQRNWDNADESNQTLFGTGFPFQAIINKQAQLTTDSGTDVRTRLDFAGTWQNFTAEVDVQVPSSSSASAGLVYRTTGWQNTNDTYAYSANVSTNSLLLGRGTNTSSGAGSFTTISNVSISLTGGSVHRLKLVINGNTHQIYLDGVLLINATDSTWTAAGNIGLRTFNNSGSTISTLYDNFGVCTALSGTWQSPALNIAGPGTYGNSAVFWDIDGLPDSTTSITAQTSIDGGSTFQTVTNGGAISGLTAGQSLTGKTLILKLTLTASNAPIVPVLNGVTAWVMGQYSSSGTRVSPALALSSVGRAANSLINYNANLPSNTRLDVATSIDSGTTYQPLANAGDYIPTISTAAYYAAVRANSPVAFYRLNEKSGKVAYDSSNNGNTATLNGGITLGQPGVLAGINESGDTAMLFDGSTGYIALPSAVTTNGLTAFTVGCWVKFAALPTTTNPRILANSHTDSDLHGIQLAVAGTSTGGFPTGAAGTVGLDVGNGTTATQINSTSQLTPGAWTHIAVTWDGSNLRLYWNGTLQSTVAFAGPISNTSNVFNIGRNGVYNGDYAAMTTQGVEIHSTALSQAAITAIYNASVNATMAVTDDTFTTNTSANYTQSNFGGVTGSWTWDTANSRLTGSGGTNGTIVHNPALSAADNQVMADFDQCDGSGIIANYIGSNNLYFVQIWDGSGTGTQNAVKLFKRSGGTNTQLGTTATIAWTRGNYKRFILDVQAGVLTVSLDGKQLIQVTDGSPLGAGKAGLLLNTLVRCYSLRIQQYGQNVSALSLLTKLTLTSTDPTVTPQVLDLQAFVSSTDIGIGKLIDKADYIRTYLSPNLADLNQKCGTTWWYVRPDKSVVFQDRTATPAPWILDSANETPYAGQQQGDVLIQNLELDTSGDLYRNRQILTGVIGSTNYTETKIGDGSTRTWNVANALTAPPTTWALNGQAVTFGIRGVDSGKQFYYQIGSTSLTQDNSGTILASTDALVISYPGAFVTEVVRDNASPGTFANTVSQSEMAAIDHTTGIVENVLDVSSLNMTVAAAQTYGDQLLQRYGLPNGRTLTFMTLRSGLAPGQALTGFVLQQLCVDVQFLVTAVSITAQDAAVPGGVLYWFKVDATETANLGSWVRILASGLSQ